MSTAGLLPQTAEYALRIVVWLAEHATQPRPAQEIARDTQIPARYVFRVLRRLADTGLVRTQRGRKGGYVLARPPAQISMLDVINAVSPLARIERCPLGLAEHEGQLCALHAALDNAYATLVENLRAVTMAQLLEHKRRCVPLCRRKPNGKKKRTAR